MEVSDTEGFDLMVLLEPVCEIEGVIRKVLEMSRPRPRRIFHPVAVVMDRTWMEPSKL